MHVVVGRQQGASATQFRRRAWLGLPWALLVAGCSTTLHEGAPLPAEPPPAAIQPASFHEATPSPVASTSSGPDLRKVFYPSNDREWVPDQAVLAKAEFDGDRVTVRNIRNCEYLSADDFVVRYYDKTFDLRQLDSVDFIMVPFKEAQQLGHTMMSFGFGGRDYLCVSVEIRREKGEEFGALSGFFNQYEVMYVVGDERDLIRLRTDHRLDEVFVYPTRVTKAQARDLFVDVMRRVNKLAVYPEFYNTLTNSCTTNIRNHINRLVPERVPYDYRVLLPGYSDKLAYDLGLIDTELSFPETKQRAKVNYLAYLYHDAPDFSRRIRQ